MNDFNTLTEYKPMVKIHLYDKSEIITEKKHEGVIIAAWKKKAVITVWSLTISWAQIAKIEPLDYNDYNQINFKIPEKYKKAIDVKAKTFQDKIGRYPNEDAIKKWCMKLDRWQSLDAPEDKVQYMDNAQQKEVKAKRLELTKWLRDNRMKAQELQVQAQEFFKGQEWFTRLSQEAQKTLLLSKMRLLIK